MSYTTVDWMVESTSCEENSAITGDETSKIDVTVKNTGSYSGRDVVQLYYSAPYTQGGIEKSAINLGAFAKTAVLKPGEFTTVTLEMSVSDMKSYDCSDRKHDGPMGYELDAGD